MSNFTKYEDKKKGFAVTKDDREREEQEKKREKLLAKVSKLDLVKAEQEFESLNKASYLAPHQHERRHFLQQAISILKKQHAEATAMEQQAEDAKIKALKEASAGDVPSSASQHSSKKRPRAGDVSDDDDDDLYGERRNSRPVIATQSSVVVSSSAWSSAIDSFAASSSAAKHSAPSVVIQRMGARANASSGALGFVPRIVMQQRREAPKTAAATSEHISYEGPDHSPQESNSAEIDSFLDDL